MTVLPIHIVAGGLALVFGYVALFAPKGATLHRKSGMFFVIAMVTMSLTGALMAVLDASTINVIGGVLTFYFVTTSLLTVRPRTDRSYWIDRAGMVVGFAVAALAFRTGYAILGTRPEAIPMFIFGFVGVLAAIGDARMIRAGGLQGSRRIARHLWRMCFAMWVAAASFFWGPPGRVPDVIYYPALLPIPVLTPVVVMLYWLWRVRVRNTLRGLVGVSASPVAVLEKP